MLAQYWVYLVYLNKKKDKQLQEHDARMAASGDEKLLEAWHDQTDFENPYFRYSI